MKPNKAKMEIELHVRGIKNGFLVWDNGTYETVYCRNYEEVIETIKEILKKFVK